MHIEYIFMERQMTTDACATHAPIDPARSIGKIAVALPESVSVFRRYKLDYCCGGQVSLQQAVADKGLDLPTVLAELSALQRSNALPETRKHDELIDHILERYHEVHRAQMPELIRMAHRVEAVHKERPEVPAGLAQVLEAMYEDLLSHMQKEEVVLFPMMRSGGGHAAGGPIAAMRHEHDAHGAALEEVARLTTDMVPPECACTTWQALYGGLAQLRDDLMSHIHLENNVLFPMFEQPAA